MAMDKPKKDRPRGVMPISEHDRPPRPESDPTRVLDGWRPDADAAPFDPTRVLDGWKPEVARDARRLDPALPLIDIVAAPAAPEPGAGGAVLDELNLGAVARSGRADRWNRGDAGDITDIEAVWKPGSDVSRSANESSLRPGADDEPLTVWRKPGVARLLAHWKPGAWVGAARRVFGAVSQVHSTPEGPIVDTFAPHLLLALWAPQGIDTPFLARWPQRLLLSAVDAEDAGEELLKHLPADAELWLAEHDIDWALAGEAVLLHDPGLRDFQLKELRAFIESERQANYERLNQAYRLPAAGQPIERV